MAPHLSRWMYACIFKNPNSDKDFFQGFSRTSTTTTTIVIENSTQLVPQHRPKVLVSENKDGSNSTSLTHFGNFSSDVKNVSDFKDTHLIELKNDPKNESFSEGKLLFGQEVGNRRVKSDGLDLKFGLGNKRGKISDGKISQILRNYSGSSFEECDIFDGRWVRDDSKPYYPAGSCPFVDKDMNCHLNGRPDNEYVKWRWQPFGCDIPSLNATDFLERLRGKKMVFVGDSLNRNMWESLVCILRHSLKYKRRDYNCTVDFVVSPFLVRESSFKGKNGSFETLRLDLMDRTTSMYQDADILIFNTGHWWTHEKTSRGLDYYQEGNHVYPRLKALDAYTRALSTWSKWVDKNIDPRRTQVIFRGYSVTHFWGGQWNSGGQCHTETEPISNTSHLTKYPSKMRAFDNVMRTMKTPMIYLNISRLTDYRKDGHPSVYRATYKLKPGEHAQDCSHWCLPGVPDTWNELLYASLLKVGRGSWKR
ncbi:PMR5 N-terminal domain, PC-Esterase [Artemisia annua]|uniref:PMR5 N-terminal domain, PC-Esterase n=1 Tax=Artemisia annua TaxID=35608 RepID=A0A2U1NK71_ARTAN|nr:PMR5 N-terminal domain, PC-Esterase [Artemisia annua]